MSILGAAALLMATLAQASGTHVHATVREIRLDGRRDRVSLRDVDGDGRAELLATTVRTIPFKPWHLGGPFWIAPNALLSSSRGISDRRLSVYWMPADGTVGSTATARIPLDARCFALADVLDTPGLELLVADGRGWLAGSIARGQSSVELQRFAECPSFFDYPEDDSLPEWSGIVRGKSAASDAVLSPGPAGYIVLRRASSGYAAAEELTILPRVQVESSANRSFAATKSLPRPVVRDLDGDGNIDVGFADPSGAPQMVVYAGRSSGRLSEEALVRTAPSLRKELRDDNLTIEVADATDLNADGICDMLVSRTSGNIGLWETLTTSQLVYFGRRGTTGFDPVPDQVVSSIGVSIVPRVIDFNGDGKLDLLVSSYRTDLLSNVRNAVLNSARVTYFLFLMENGKYPQNPNVERNIDLDFKLLERGGITPRAYFDGDFDGDGIKDLLAVEEEHKIRAYRGTVQAAGVFQRATYEFAKDPMMELDVRASNDLQIVDLDGDGRFEVVIPDNRFVVIARYQP